MAKSTSEKNETQHPLYGCAIVGGYWSFMVLNGKDYCVGTAYDYSDRIGLQNIVLILRKFKHILLTELAV